MTVYDAIDVLIAGPTSRIDVFEALYGAGLLRLSWGTGSTWVLTEDGQQRFAERKEARHADEHVG